MGPPERLGATPTAEGGCSFCVWAPAVRKVEVKLSESRRTVPLERVAGGYHVGTLPEVAIGAAYSYRLDGELERPDPASKLQLEGVHGPSRVYACDHSWQDVAWRGIPLGDYVLYELHVGTFSRAGSFAGIIPQLERLRELGITALELMPIAQFPGSRNWGYDGVYPFAVQDSYGGPRGLAQLVDACHRVGIAVVLDVVYNHLGPEGNYLSNFGPYFTDRYQTPWGSALNFDGPQSEGVRRYFIENALQWLEDFHVDALRLDAAHAIIDRSALPFLEELADRVRQLAERQGRPLYLIAESDLNDPRLVRPSALGGYGLDAMWCDDFHHAAHVLLTGERGGYYSDFGTVDHLAQAFRSGMCNVGRYSEFRQRRHGRPGPDLRPEQRVVCLQNHDQVGNRLFGDRLSRVVGFEQQKLAAGLACLAPFVPLLFMGEEYGEIAPFQYFVSHQDPALLKAIREGRQKEFASFAWHEAAPDPGAEETFLRSQLDPELRHAGPHAVLYRLYRALLQLRPQLRADEPDECVSLERQKVLSVLRCSRTWLVFCFSAEPEEVELPLPPGDWRLLISSADKTWEGPGTTLPAELLADGCVRLQLPPHSFACYQSRSVPHA